MQVSARTASDHLLGARLWPRDPMIRSQVVGCEMQKTRRYITHGKFLGVRKGITMPRTRLTESMRMALPETRFIYRIGPGMQCALSLLAHGPWPNRFALAQAVATEQNGYWRDAYRSIQRLEEIGLVTCIPYGPVEVTDVGWRYIRRLHRRNVRSHWATVP
jgi:hypothetical protein